MPKVKCDYCGKEHYRKPTRIWENNYCCNDCYQKGRLTKNIIIEENDYAEIIIEKDNTNLKIKIDKEDIDKVKQYRWCARYDKTINGYYVEAWERGENRKRLKLHRYITNCPKDMVVDHINRDTLDNRKQNLKVCTQQENAKNKGMYKNNKLGLKYIYLNKKGQYIVSKRINGKIFRIGSRKNLQEAIAIRDEFLKKESEENND